MLIVSPSSPPARASSAAPSDHLHRRGNRPSIRSTTTFVCDQIDVVNYVKAAAQLPGSARLMKEYRA
jgi:hypothetical protein